MTPCASSELLRSKAVDKTESCKEDKKTPRLMKLGDNRSDGAMGSNVAALKLERDVRKNGQGKQKGIKANALWLAEKKYDC